MADLITNVNVKDKIYSNLIKICTDNICIIVFMAEMWIQFIK